MTIQTLNERLFYIQDTRTYCGNSVMWWCVDGHGYTSDLSKAWKVPATWKGRDTDKLWACDEIDERATRQFDMQRFREIDQPVRPENPPTRDWETYHGRD